MSCGGALVPIPKEDVRTEAPPQTFENADEFWRCSGCSKLLWKGTHWKRIGQRLEAARGLAGMDGERAPSDPGD
jgi:hypothetical protein